jgi:hypothetical protein
MRIRFLWTAVATLLLLDAVGIAIGCVLRARRDGLESVSSVE